VESPRPRSGACLAIGNKKLARCCSNPRPRECQKLAEDRAGDKTRAAQFYGRALTIYRDMSASDPSNGVIRSDPRRLG
jgi:hypothetical protein